MKFCCFNIFSLFRFYAGRSLMLESEGSRLSKFYENESEKSVRESD